MEIERKKTKAEEREFYKDYIYPKPKETGVKKRPEPAGGKSAGKKYAVIILVIFALIAALLLSDYLSNGLAIGLFKKNSNSITIKAAEYYAAETGAFTSMRLAEARSAETASRGGAGYIYNDGTFHVLASAHTKKTDAETAAKAFDGADVFVLKIQSKTITYTGSKTGKEAARKAFAAPPEIFSQMINMSAKLKSGGLTAEQAKSKLQILETDTQTLLDSLEDPDGGPSMPVIRIKAELTGIVNILSDTGASDSNNAEFRRVIDYNAVKIICSFKDVVSEL